MREWSDVQDVMVCPECEGVTWDAAVEEWGTQVRSCDYHKWLRDRERWADKAKEDYYREKYEDGA